ncbi:MAG: helix-turn-helix transcriptional regulator [bacterium]|nr:helix-turn-helix transcriptional regulator [bacterium]
MTNSPMTLDQFLETDLFRVLAEPARLRLIQLLWRLGRADVSTLAEEMTQDRSVVSRHLKVLSGAGIVRAEKVGRHQLYELEADAFVEKLQGLVDRVRACVGGECGQCGDDASGM